MSSLPLIYPPLLSPGDVIGLAAPASPPDQPEKINVAIDKLTRLGFSVRTGEHLRERDSYLAGSDAQRAGDINALFTDPEVKGIFALRGGYGSCRILPLLDYAAIRANPKPFIGYSDITAMHNAILVKSGLVTFHGQNSTEAFLPGNEAVCRAMLLGGPESPSVLFSRASHPELRTLIPGRAQGRLIGGNMTCLLRLLGTPYEPDFQDAILFLEDIGEKAYRIDGMFSHLRLSGVLDRIGGLVLGRFSHDDAGERARIAVCLEKEAAAIGVPCLSDAPIGHFAEQVIIPHGVEAVLDAGQGMLRIGQVTTAV